MGFKQTIKLQLANTGLSNFAFAVQDDVAALSARPCFVSFFFYCDRASSQPALPSAHKEHFYFLACFPTLLWILINSCGAAKEKQTHCTCSQRPSQAPGTCLSPPTALTNRGGGNKISVRLESCPLTVRFCAADTA